MGFGGLGFGELGFRVWNIGFGGLNRDYIRIYDIWDGGFRVVESPVEKKWKMKWRLGRCTVGVYGDRM